MSLSPPVTRAFILGAGLGKRLRPLTADLPKPLVPVRGRPLVAWGIEHLSRAGVRHAIINTHHAAHRWSEAFPSMECDGVRLEFRHEPVLLDTGGGLKNVESFFPSGETFLIYNGDILTSLPLGPAVEHHRHAANLATLVLRRTGGPLHVSLGADGRVADIRGRLGTGLPEKYLFTGIHVVEPRLFGFIPRVRVESIIAIYLDLIRRGEKIGGVVLDEGDWSDVGTPEEYERVNGRTPGSGSPKG